VFSTGKKRIIKFKRIFNNLFIEKIRKDFREAKESDF
jgi:hypothetical protein